MLSRWGALLVWGLVAASVVFWALRMSVSPIAVPPGTAVAAGTSLGSADLSRLLGAPAAAPVEVVAAPPSAASRFRLTGIVATGSARRGADDRRAAPGIALISIDGGPPRPFLVGATLDGGLSLLSVGLRSARLGNAAAPGQADFVLELPPPTPAATGTMPSVAFAAPPAAALPAPPAAAPPMPAPNPAGRPPTTGPSNGMPPQLDGTDERARSLRQ